MFFISFLKDRKKEGRKEEWRKREVGESKGEGKRDLTS